MAEMIDADKIRYFLTCLYGAVEADSRLVLSYANLDKKLRSEWIKPDDVEAAVRFFTQHAANRSTYYGVGLRGPEAYVGPTRRGGIPAVTQMVALWADIDIRGAGHKEEALPETKEQAMRLIYDATRPLQPSLIVFTGGGAHAYWLFKEPFAITSDADRKRIADLNRRLNRQIVLKAEEHGWQIDSVHSLDRVLRVPGTTTKYGGMVTIEQDNAIRYELSTLDHHLAPLPLVAMTTPGAGTNLSGLDIMAIAEHYDATFQVKSEARSEYEGAHPVHGSTTGDNFNVNTAEQVWRCWRHGTGGDVLYLIAMCEGWIACKDVQHGAMTGENNGGTREGGRLYVKAAKTANKRFGGRIELKSNNGGNSGSLPWSDYTNGLALVRNFGADLRYCYPWKKWLVWTGTHWQLDNSGVVMRMAKQTIRRMAQRIEGMDEAEAKALLGHIKKSLSTNALRAMVESAQSEEGIPVQPDELDRDPWLLNCLNGTVDLRSGMLTHHSRADLITRCLQTSYDPDTDCPIWQRFLDRIMSGNENLIRFLKQAVGYAITGVIREHILIILWGGGRNGKSTFLNTLLVLLKAYAMKAPSELLMVSNNDRHPTERADLAGKRLICAIETEEGRRLAETFVKEATGGDPIRARRMREDFWEFEPTHKVFLATNHKPVIRGTDNAIWERIRLVPFGVTIPEAERDPKLPEKLQGELPGILAWAVQGCLDWQQNGLSVPSEVRQATEGYRADMDLLGQFIGECCVTGSGQYRVKASDLYDEYKRWTAGDNSISQRAFGIALTERGYERTRGHGGAYWYVGLGLSDTKSTDGERMAFNRSPVQDTDKESDRRETGQLVNEGEPKNGINQLRTLCEGNTQKKGSPSFTRGANSAISSADSTSCTGERMVVNRSPVRDDSVLHIPDPNDVVAAPQQCLTCGIWDGSCSHMLKRNK